MDINGIDNLRDHTEKMTSSLQETMEYLNKTLDVDKNFDLVYRVIKVGKQGTERSSLR